MTNPISRIMVDFVQMKSFVESPFVIDRAEGVYLYDADGKDYIDGIAGVFVASVGHRNTTVLESIVDQLNQLTFAPPLVSTNTPALKLAEKIADLTPPQFNRVKYLSGGSEAVETALKMALQYHKQNGQPERYKFLSAYGSYHGGTLGALSVSGVSSRRSSFEPLMGNMLHVHPPNFRQCPLKLGAEQCEISCVLQFEEVIKREGPETIAAIVIEPVMNVEGLVIPPKSYFQTLRALSDKYGILLIYDEVITGFGRTGTLFFAEQVDAWPDIFCVGKGMSGGYAPLAATIVSDKVGDTFWGDDEDVVQYNGGHTYAGNPLSCATGHAILEYFEQHNVLDHIAKTGPYLRDKLKSIQAQYPEEVADVRGIGLWWGIELRQNNTTGKSKNDIGRRLERATRQRGLIVRGSANMISFGPPLTITTDEIDEMMNRLDQAMSDVYGS
jgi:adenosylmethionine-8-amino-7-oxononanoate aminotransferase